MKFIIENPCTTGELFDQYAAAALTGLIAAYNGDATTAMDALTHKAFKIASRTLERRRLYLTQLDDLYHED